MSENPEFSLISFKILFVLAASRRQMRRNTATTLPAIMQESVMMGSMEEFSG